jgi:predicted DNA-binding transcriptional regulator YafY
MPRTGTRNAATLPLSLTPEEAAAIAVALAAQPEGPYAADGTSALDKVLAALEPDPRRREALAARTLLVRAEVAGARGGRSALDEGLARRLVLVLRYRDGQGATSLREVEPQLLARTAEHEYLVAWCRERQAVRWFRTDRIESVEVTAEPAPRRDPATFGAPPIGDHHPTHPAGRALRNRAEVPHPRLVLLPGGRQV